MPPTTTSDLLPATTLFDRDPIDTGEATTWIRERIQAGMRAALQIAALLAHVRDVYYSDDAAGWLAWGHQEFGYQRRFLFQCLSAGRLLTRVHHGALLGCDLQKLDYLASVPEAQLPALLDRWDPAAASRDEVRRKVALFRPSETITCDTCGEEFEPTRRKQTICDACEKAADQKKRTRRASGCDRALGDIAGLTEDEKQLLAGEIAPGVAMRAGLNSIELAFMSIERTSCWSDEDYAMWEAKLAEVQESFRYLASNRRRAE